MALVDCGLSIIMMYSSKIWLALGFFFTLLQHKYNDIDMLTKVSQLFDVWCQGN